MDCIYAPVEFPSLQRLTISDNWWNILGTYDVTSSILIPNLTTIVGRDPFNFFVIRAANGPGGISQLRAPRLKSVQLRLQLQNLPNLRVLHMPELEDCLGKIQRSRVAIDS